MDHTGVHQDVEFSGGHCCFRIRQQGLLRGVVLLTRGYPVQMRENEQNVVRSGHCGNPNPTLFNKKGLSRESSRNPKAMGTTTSKEDAQPKTEQAEQQPPNPVVEDDDEPDEW